MSDVGILGISSSPTEVTCPEDVFDALNAKIEILGMENTRIFIDALREFQESLKHVLHPEINGSLGTGLDTRYMVRKKLETFVKHNEEILDICGSVFNQNPGSTNNCCY